MTTTKNTKTTARQKFDAMIESRTLTQAISDLTVNTKNESTTEGMMIRVALIGHIEKLSPAIAAWVSDFYDGEDDAPCWDIDYPDAILLARAELGI